VTRNSWTIDRRGDGNDDASAEPSGETRSGIVVRTTPGRPETAVISLVGAHDLSTSPMLERHAVEHLAHADRLVVDLSQASFVDSSIVNTLVGLARQARPRGVTFQVIAVDGSHPQRVLALMGLLGHLGWIDSLSAIGLRAAPRSGVPDHPESRAG
jgi:anti-anti-sigma factor